MKIDKEALRAQVKAKQLAKLQELEDERQGLPISSKEFTCAFQEQVLRKLFASV